MMVLVPFSASLNVVCGVWWRYAVVVILPFPACLSLTPSPSFSAEPHCFAPQGLSVAQVCCTRESPTWPELVSLDIKFAHAQDKNWGRGGVENEGKEERREEGGNGEGRQGGRGGGCG